MNNTIAQIAKASRGIVAEADAQKITTEDEVEALVVELLSDPATLEKIKSDALFRANETAYNTYRGYRYYDYRESLEAHFSPKLELLAEEGIDYGPLSCFVEVGCEAYPDIKEAIKHGIIDSWGGCILSAAEKAVNEEAENAEEEREAENAEEEQ